MPMSTTDREASEDPEVIAAGDRRSRPTLRFDGWGGRRRAVLVALVVLACAVFGWWSARSEGLPDGAAFRVGQEVVAIQDVTRRVDALEALYGVEQPVGAEEAEFLPDVAKSMAVQLMLRSEADERGIVVPAKVVDETLQTLVEQRYRGEGRSGFIAALGEMGATEQQVREEIENQIVISRLFEQVTDGVVASDTEVRSAFEARREELGTAPRRVLRNVVVADRRTAAAVLRRLESGEPFEETARTFSLDSSTSDSGGLLGAITRDELEQTYGDAAFSGDVGTFFGPVRSRHGWNVGLVVRALPGEPARFRALRGPLRETVRAEESLAAWRAWLGEVISSHPVSYADDYRPADPGEVPDLAGAPERQDLE